MAKQSKSKVLAEACKNAENIILQYTLKLNDIIENQGREAITSRMFKDVLELIKHIDTTEIERERIALDKVSTEDLRQMVADEINRTEWI